MNIAIITARSQSERFPGKHLKLVAGRPLIEWPIKAACEAKRIEHVYLASDRPDPLVRALKGNYDKLHTLKLPKFCVTKEAAQAHSLLWAVTHVDKIRSVQNVVALLGNTVMIDSKLIDQSLAVLARMPEADSVMTVWEAEDDHPYRAMKVNEDGFLESLGLARQSSNVQGYPKVYYHDQGLWTFRLACVYRQEGPPPWTWMGRKTVPLIRKWWAGRDVDTPFDLILARIWAEMGEEGCKSLT